MAISGSESIVAPSSQYLSSVASGQLITASLFNTVVNTVNNLLSRVSTLEGGGGEVTFAAFQAEPEMEALQVGDVELNRRVLQALTTLEPEDLETLRALDDDQIAQARQRLGKISGR